MNAASPEPENQQTMTLDLQCLPSLCRGLYNRVARKVGCDPSYVSRVARGERYSEAVSAALRAEIQATWVKASDRANRNGKGESGNAEASKAEPGSETGRKAPRKKAQVASV